MNLIKAKVYYDGSHWIAIPHTERPFRQRRRATENVDNSEKVIQFENAFKSTPKGKKATKKEKLLKEFKPLFKTESEAAEFVEEQYLSRKRTGYGGVINSHRNEVAYRQGRSVGYKGERQAVHRLTA